ncbi:24554_t:CDS:2, partial [Cetraspora pellucida]
MFIILKANYKLLLTQPRRDTLKKGTLKERCIKRKTLKQSDLGLIHVWIDGYITGFNDNENKWNRNGKVDVCLKGLDNSRNIKQEFLEENQHKQGGESAIAIYGITKNPKDSNYMMVMEYAKQGSLRKLLDSKYTELDWGSK